MTAIPEPRVNYRRLEEFSAALLVALAACAVAIGYWIATP